MSKFLSLVRKKNRSRFSKTSKGSQFVEKLRQNPKMFGFLLITLIIFMGLSYIVQVNINATRGFEVSELASQMDDIESENKKLEIKAAELRSLENIQRIKDHKSLEKVTYIDYIENANEAVALGR